MSPTTLPSINSTTGRTNLFRPAATALSHLAPWLAAPLAEQLFITPLRSHQPERERQWASDAERLTLPSPHGPLAAWSWGDGPRTVLLQHGWAGRGLQLGGLVAPLRRQGMRVVTYDAPSQGGSPGRTSSLPEIIEALTIAGRTFGPLAGVVAHSLGATATLLAMARGQLAAERVVALAPAASIAAVISRYGQLTGFTRPVLERMQGRLTTRLGLCWQEIEPLPVIAGVTVPLLVVHDYDDREVPWSDGVTLAERSPQARLQLTHGLGHYRLLRDPSVIARTVRFLTTPQAVSDDRHCHRFRAGEESGSAAAHAA